MPATCNAKCSKSKEVGRSLTINICFTGPSLPSSNRTVHSTSYSASTGRKASNPQLVEAILKSVGTKYPYLGSNEQEPDRSTFAREYVYTPKLQTEASSVIREEDLPDALTYKY